MRSFFGLFVLVGGLLFAVMSASAQMTEAQAARYNTLSELLTEIEKAMEDPAMENFQRVGYIDVKRMIERRLHQHLAELFPNDYPSTKMPRG